MDKIKSKTQPFAKLHKKHSWVAGELGVGLCETLSNNYSKNT